MSESDLALQKKVERALRLELRSRDEGSSECGQQSGISGITDSAHIVGYRIVECKPNTSKDTKPSQVIRIAGQLWSQIHLPIKKVRIRVGGLVLSKQLNEVGRDLNTLFDFEFKARRGQNELYLEVSFEKDVWIPVFQATVLRSLFLKYGSVTVRLQSPVESREIDPSYALMTCYREWIKQYDTWRDADAQRAKEELKRFATLPLISILLLADDGDDAVAMLSQLNPSIESLKAQVYSNWELCIVMSPFDSDQKVVEFLHQLASEDERIKHVQYDSKNAALAHSTGGYVASLELGDVLAPHALFKVVEAVNAHPLAKLIYSDQDELDEEGRRIRPFFKPDWNPDLFLHQNYLHHLVVYQRELVSSVGGYADGLTACQDWDLTLRFIEQIEDEQIVHIPHVLYHQSTGASAASLISKSSSSLSAWRLQAHELESAVQLLDEHFSRIKQQVEVESITSSQSIKICYPLPTAAPHVTLVIPTKNAHDILSVCLQTILEGTDYPAFDVLIIDNNSDDTGSLAYFEKVQQEHKQVKVLPYPHPFNFSALCNFGAKNASGEVVAMVNNDVEVISPQWLREMVSHAIRPEIGAVGARLYYPDGSLQHAGVVLGIGGVADHAFKHLKKGDLSNQQSFRATITSNYTAVTAACLIIEKEKYFSVEGMNEVDLTVGFNDVDLCLKLHAAGYRNLYCAEAELVHHESISRGTDEDGEKLKRFQKEHRYILAEWQELLNKDPSYNPNLSVNDNSFGLAHPPRTSACMFHMNEEAVLPSDMIAKFVNEDG